MRKAPNSKVFSVLFRWRGPTNSLEETWESIEATSKAKARDWGKSIARERAAGYDGKYWFMGVELFPELFPEFQKEKYQTQPDLEADVRRLTAQEHDAK